MPDDAHNLTGLLSAAASMHWSLPRCWARRARGFMWSSATRSSGGCIRSGEITEPRLHTHDLMAATFVLFITSPAFAELGDDLARHGLEFCNGSSPTGVLRPDGSSLILTTDREANVARYEALAAGDGATLSRRGRARRTKRRTAVWHSRRACMVRRDGRSCWARRCSARAGLASWLRRLEAG